MKPLFAALAAAVLVTGCSALGLSEKPNPRSICPQGLILADAGEVTIFRDGPGRDLTDVVAQAKVADVVIDCKPERRQVRVDLQVAIAAERGPANRAGKQPIDYFVAVVDPQGQILNRQSFRMNFEWPENRLRIGQIDELEPRIAIEAPDKAPGYQIWVGLQLTEEQLAWNRRNKPSR
ncbi:MAG: hypothetical protein JNK67_01470 [Alphaproteobacteria bacterium]|nr:hypothetical protein [Alphaproteobacteria bacterium]